MAKIRARHQGTKRIYIHNDLSNAAYHFKTEIERKKKANNVEGIFFDYMACLVMLAFTVEAKINFIGHRLFDAGWKERRPFIEKAEAVFHHLGIAYKIEERPYLAILFLKEFRDLIAHGKPEESEFNEEVIRVEEQMDRINDLTGKWERYCTEENVLQAYEDVEQIWRELLEAAGLNIAEASTHGASSLTFIENITEA